MNKKIAVIIVAAGTGSRAGAGLPKQFRMLGNKPLIRHSLEIFASYASITHIQPVIHQDYEANYAQAVAHMSISVPVYGGATRQESVLAGLKALEKHAPDYVLIHDAARPYVSTNLIDALIVELSTHKAVIPTLPLTDTIKQVDSSGVVISTLERASLRAVQTPQAFHYDTIVAAHRDAAHNNYSDDAAIAEAAAIDVYCINGDSMNRKITFAEDLHV